MAGRCPQRSRAELIASHRSDLHNFSGFGTTFITLMVRPQFNDGTPNPLADQRIRTALAMSIDKEQIVKSITRCGEQPATTYIPPTIFADQGWRSTPGVPFNVKRARQLLAEAGYPDGGTLPGVSYLFRSGNSTSKMLAENLVRQWKENLNLNIPLEQVELKIANQEIKQKNYSITASNWIGDYDDPSTFTDKYLSTSVNNDSGWVRPRYDQLVHAAAKEPDSQKRLRILEKAERMINEQLPIIPLYHLTNQELFRSNVKGINTNPRNMTMFKAVEVVK